MTLDQAGLDFYLSPATDFGYSSVYLVYKNPNESILILLN